MREASREEGRWKKEEKEGAGSDRGRPGNLDHKRRLGVGAFGFGNLFAFALAHLYLETLCLAPPRPEARQKERACADAAGET